MQHFFLGWGGGAGGRGQSGIRAMSDKQMYKVLPSDTVFRCIHSDTIITSWTNRKKVDFLYRVSELIATNYPVTAPRLEHLLSAGRDPFFANATFIAATLLVNPPVHSFQTHCSISRLLRDKIGRLSLCKAMLLPRPARPCNHCVSDRNCLRLEWNYCTLHDTCLQTHTILWRVLRAFWHTF